MYYFVPAWFKNPDRPFYNVAQPWYWESNRLEFDDAINQLKMFQQADQDVKLLNIGYMPSLRSFLHRQEIDNLKYFSIFDELQAINVTGMRRIALADLNFPAEVEFNYTPFKIFAFKASMKYAEIELGNLGEILKVTLYENEALKKTYVFDDRGFLSSIMYYENNAPVKQTYLNLNGEVRFSEDLVTKEITVTPNFQAEFRQAHYQNIQALVTERLLEFLKIVTPKDTFVLAAGGGRTKLTLELLTTPKIVLSYFSGRNKQAETLPTEQLAKVDLVVADTKKTAELLKESYPAEKIQLVTPFDTRLRLGHSQRLAQVKLLFLVDQVTPKVFKAALEQLLTLVEQRKDLELEVGILRRNDYDLENLKEKILKKAPELQVLLPGELDEQGENELEEMTYTGKVTLNYLDTENALVKTMDQTRILIDLGTPPNLYAQIAAISAGIPQITLAADSLVEHQKNGLQLQNDVKKLTSAIAYYTDGLKHWNEAMTHAVAKIADLTGGKLVNQWEQWLKDTDK